jgi:hypothetical protein
MTPGRCKGNAHKLKHLGIAGRRVLVSRKWSNKTLDVPICSTCSRIAQWRVSADQSQCWLARSPATSRRDPPTRVLDRMMISDAGAIILTWLAGFEAF